MIVFKLFIFVKYFSKLYHSFKIFFYQNVLLFLK